MELHQIETALRGQFVWHKKPRKRFHCDPEVECSADTAIIVFIGLADMNGFKEEDICDYLAIDLVVYRRLSVTYRTKMKEAADKINNQLWNDNRHDLAQRIWMKSGLVRNNIIYQSNIKMSDFPFM